MRYQPGSSNLSLAPSANAGPLIHTASGSILRLASRVVPSIWAVLFLLIWMVDSAALVRAQQAEQLAPSASAAGEQQTTLPFEVSNPKHKKWPEAEAGRIYNWACSLLARTIRPEKPPQLHPKFRLVLGSDTDELVRDRNASEIHLKVWNSEKFAQGVVVVALRDLVPGTDLAKLARQSVSLADATVDARELH
jgi:hypothetical protein